MPELTKTHVSALRELVTDFETVGAIFVALDTAYNMQTYVGYDTDIVSDQYRVLIDFLNWRNGNVADIRVRERMLIAKIEHLIAD